MSRQLSLLLGLIDLKVILIFIAMSICEVLLVIIFLSVFSSANIDIFEVFYLLKRINVSLEVQYTLIIAFIIFNVMLILYLQFLLIKKSQSAASKLTKLIFWHEINSIPLDDQLHSSSVNKILSESVIRFADGVVLPLYSLLQKLSAASIIIIVVLLHSLYFSLALILGFSIFLLIVNKFINRTFSSNNPKISHLSLLRSKIISDGITGKKMIFSYKKQNYWDSLLSIPNSKLFQLRAQNAWILTVPRALIEALVPTLLAIYFALKNTMELQSLSLFDLVPSIVIFLRLAPLMQLANANYNNLKSNMYALDELGHYHSYLPKLNQRAIERSNKKTDANLIKSIRIELKNVSISIDNNPIKYPDLSLNTGEIYLIKGPSGSGKSLFLSLLAGHINPDLGSINSFRSSALESTSEHLNCRMMQQKDFLFAGTVEENLVFDETLSDERREFISSLFKQLQLYPEIDFSTRINENGNNISGGQAQRLHLIRCLSDMAPVYLLDEPTSALDPNLENIVIQILKEISKRSIVVIATHSDSSALDKLNTINLRSSAVNSQKKGTYFE